MDKFLVSIIANTIRDSPCIHSWIPYVVWHTETRINEQHYLCRYCEMQINQQVFEEIGKEKA